MTRLGLIGTGKIGSAVMTGYARCNYTTSITISSRSSAKSEALKTLFPSIVTVCESNQEIIDNSDVIFIGLLPAVARELLPSLVFTGKKVVSMMATIPYHTLLSLVSMEQDPENVVRTVPLPSAARNTGPILTYCNHDNITFFTELLSQVGTPVVCKKEEEITTLTSITGMISFFYAICDTFFQWSVSNNVSPSVSKSFVTAFFQSLSSVIGNDDSFEEMAVEAATPGGLNEQSNAGCRATEVYQRVADQLDALYKRLSS